MSERNGRPGRAYDENHDNWSAWTESPAEPKRANIAEALLEAERRGMERAAEIATERLCPDTAKAIRAAASRDS